MKVRRKQAILELIKKEVVTTQAEIAAALSEEGYNVTQATISRDIKELGLVKIPVDGDTYRYFLAESSMKALPKDRLRRLMRDSVLRLEAVENLIIIKTLPGSAQALASAIDSAELPTIAGTIAGDDTILIIVKEKKAVEKIVADFKTLANLADE